MPNQRHSTVTIPPGKGKAVLLEAGHRIKLINTHGHQVVDTWAFNRQDVNEYMSMEYSRSVLEHVAPTVGDFLITTKRRPILTLTEDTSPGVHDTLIAACTRWGYLQQGYSGHHDNCTDNLHNALLEFGLQAPATPCPLNMFMNVPIAPDGRLFFAPPVSKAGDYVVLRAEMNCVVVFSACPQEKLPVNAGRPAEVQFEVG